MIAQQTPAPTPSLFDPIRLGPYLLPHRIFMAPFVPENENAPRKSTNQETTLAQIGAAGKCAGR